jgi:hypothetical protein
MKDRISAKDALVFITLLQQDVAGIYWMMWEAMSGVTAFRYLLEHRTGQAALPQQDLTPSPNQVRLAA